MDPRLLRYYDRELQHIREMGAEFARDFPKIAGRLGMEGLDVADPYVERLLEGFAFMSARVQLKVDAEFPRFTQHLLERVYPHYLAPLPSMAIVQYQPDFTEGSLVEGPVVKRDSILRGLLGKDDQTACEYRSAHDVALWPLEIAEAEYLSTGAAVSALGITAPAGLRAGIRLRLRVLGDASFEALSLDTLALYLKGTGEVPMHIYEQLFANNLGVAILPTQRPAKWHRSLPSSSVEQLGFDSEQALLPYSARSFQGYRLLQEYFAFPERYLFVALSQLRQVLQSCTESELDVVVLLNASDPLLENNLAQDNFALFCSPAVNLFPKRADRIHLTEQHNEHHILPDRARPLDFEVYSVTEVVGHGARHEDEQPFLPFYAAYDEKRRGDNPAYFTIHRIPRLISSTRRRHGNRSSYIGSEAFISLVDAHEAPYRTSLRQIAISTLCTNRDLPLHMPLGTGTTDFTLESGEPVASVRCVTGPTKPRPSTADREIAWHLISHLSLNYLSLTDTADAQQGAAALRELLRLYADRGEPAICKQIDEGVKSVGYRGVTRRMPIPGPIAFGRGLSISVLFDESAFAGTGVFLLGAVLERFFAKYASINTFTETAIKSETRGEIMQWPVRSGLRQTL